MLPTFLENIYFHLNFPIDKSSALRRCQFMPPLSCTLCAPRRASNTPVPQAAVGVLHPNMPNMGLCST